MTGGPVSAELQGGTPPHRVSIIRRGGNDVSPRSGSQAVGAWLSYRSRCQVVGRMQCVDWCARHCDVVDERPCRWPRAVEETA